MRLVKMPTGSREEAPREYILLGSALEEDCWNTPPGVEVKLGAAELLVVEEPVVEVLLMPRIS
jgi:hypothetical protein